MNTNESDSFEEKRIDSEAAAWVAKRLKGFTPEEQDAFFEWLAANARHGEWYATHMRTWKGLDLLAQWKPEHSDKPNQDLLKYSQARRRWIWLGGLAALLMMSFFLWTQFEESITAFGGSGTRNLVAKEYERHALPDGSIVEMNRGAALKVEYNATLRRVELVSSEAHFDVAKNPDRPFVVRVRDIDITAVGTAFNVKLTDESVELLVTEGRVRMSSSEEAEASEDFEPSYVFSEDVVAGQMLVATIEQRKTPPEVVEVATAQIDSLLSWKPLLLDFNETPLTDVIREFNSRNEVQLQVVDDALGRIPIVASFRTANVEHLVEILEMSLGVKASRINDRLIELRLE